MGGGAAVSLSAPSSGTYQGVLFFQARGNTSESTLVGGTFQQMNGALNINPLIQCRLIQARTHPGPSCQMDHLVKGGTGEYFIQSGTLGEVAVSELKRLCKRLEMLDIPPLQFRSIEIIQIVKSANRMS